tara:strand:- start:154 stop:522 length:369 start_codon:yes stop_codon:yes gene_type:complete
MVGTLLESSYFVSPAPSPDRRLPVKLRHYRRRISAMSYLLSFEKLSKNAKPTQVVIILVAAAVVVSLYLLMSPYQRCVREARAAGALLEELEERTGLIFETLTSGPFFESQQKRRCTTETSW